MSKTRKILCVVLAAALVFALAIPAFAAGVDRPENATDAQNYTQEWYLEAKPLDEQDPNSDDWEDFADYFGNGYYVVDVHLTTNYAIGAVEFEFETTGEIKIIDAVEYEYPYKHCDCNFDGNKILVLPLSSSVEAGKKCDDDAIVTVVVSGNGTMKIKNNAKTAANTGGTLIATRLEPANTATGDMYYGQKVVSVGDAVTIGTVATPVLKGINGGYVDEARKYVYGIPAKSTPSALSNLFTVENGSFVTLGIEENGFAGTGKTLTVKDSAGVVYDEYKIIVFGDVNGDGEISLTDYAATKEAALGKPFDNAESTFAADVDAINGVGLTDYAIVKEAALGSAITVNPYAA